MCSPEVLAWHKELQQLALNCGTAWLVSAEPEAHLAAYVAAVLNQACFH